MQKQFRKTRKHEGKSSGVSESVKAALTNEADTGVRKRFLLTPVRKPLATVTIPAEAQNLSQNIVPQNTLSGVEVLNTKFNVDAPEAENSLNNTKPNRWAAILQKGATTQYTTLLRTAVISDASLDDVVNDNGENKSLIKNNAQKPRKNFLYLRNVWQRFKNCINFCSSEKDWTITSIQVNKIQYFIL